MWTGRMGVDDDVACLVGKLHNRRFCESRIVQVGRSGRCRTTLAEVGGMPGNGF